MQLATSETLFFILELLATIQGLVVGAYLIGSATKGKPTLILALFLILFSLEMCLPFYGIWTFGKDRGHSNGCHYGTFGY